MSSQDSFQLNQDEIAEFNEDLSKNFDVLPLFERQYSAFVSIKKNSLKTNEKLRSRWHDRVVNGTSAGVMAMPNINDYHFHNCRTKFLPSQSLANFKSLGKHLTPGPGVDKYGQRPIPDDMIPKITATGKNKTKTKKVERHEKSKQD